MKPLVSVVAPFFNEEENAPLLAERVASVFAAQLDYDYECLFVNDGSTDGTRHALELVAAANPCVRVIHMRKNSGQSAALVAGMRAARGVYILTLDGDLQNDPADFFEILELLRDYDCVCGYRMDRRDTWLRRLSSRVANGVRRRLLGDGLRDTGCGLKGFRQCCVEYFIPFNGVHRFFGVMILMGGFTLTECPVRHHPRTHGKSKYGLNNRFWRGIHDLIGVAWLRRRYVPIHIEEEGQA